MGGPAGHGSSAPGRLDQARCPGGHQLNPTWLRRPGWTGASKWSEFIQGLVQCVEVVPGPAIPRGRLGSPWDGSPIEGRALGDPFYTRSIP